MTKAKELTHNGDIIVLLPPINNTITHEKIILHVIVLLDRNESFS